MKRVAIVSFLYASIFLAGYTSSHIGWDSPELSAYRNALERLTGRTVVGNYNVIIASSAGEFSRLSRLGYWFVAATHGETIYLQPLSLIPDLARTLAHEMSHIFFQRFNLPYWLEEGFVCTVTGEWVGREEPLLENIEELDHAGMDFMTYRAYSFTCWRRVGELLRQHGFNELVSRFVTAQ
ncbi:MAG TPA: hypothetical protein PK411_06410 [Mesotoga infera]|uniref:Peptidase MA-like domain-containing protein n=1 Tax=Mesotoga infera TaxID=1236046 RepID=A0A7Z7PSH9_9BACT|nr:hypothetical protein [Mesotoga infera]SSC13843.1 conserved protein of unknown function [Mesotoga infera]HPD37962.1 hypothetical protein [Mesotoga infera]HRR44140.1 hypothetical protein [Mesotoga sp.]HRV01367.1 hypothetical protein [Mesotoga sp.]